MIRIELVLCVLTVTFLASVDAAAQSFSISDRAAVTYDTSGTGSGVTVGYALVEPNAGSSTPAGDLIFALKDNGILVSETTVPEMLPLTTGRIYAAYFGRVNTGIAMVNPNSSDATVSFYFTPGSDFCDCPNPSVGTFTLPAHSQIARFVNQAPFNVTFGPAQGTMTFTSSIPIGVIALRGFTNERGEFLMTTLPVADLSESASSNTVFIPHYADGGGWTTEVILINKTDASISGVIQFTGSGGASASYSIAPRAMQRIVTPGTGSAATVGSVRITPNAGSVAPAGLSIFSFSNGSATLSEAGVPVLSPGRAFRMFEIEAGSHPGQLQTGLALTNPSSTDAATVTLDLSNSAGDPTGMASTFTIPPLGHTAAFVKQFPGFESIPYPFHGVLRISTTSSSGVAVIGLRVEYNALGDFLVATSMPVNEAGSPSPAAALFPHFVDGGGYTTEFILFSGYAGQASSGTLRFFTQSGTPLN